MNSLLSILLPIIFAAQPLTEIHMEKVLFSKLPVECAAEYDSFLRKERNAVSTDVIKADLDGNGTLEMLVWTGNGGTGGEEWSVMQYNGTKYICLGQIFGCLFSADHHGILVCYPIGWEYATWTFYQIQHGKLQKCIEFDIRYARPIREEPVEIKVKYYEDNQLRSEKKDV